MQGIPGVNFPNPLRRFRRLDFGPERGIASNVPVREGKPYPLLLPAVDADGNETCGIRMPIIAVPLASHTGWNLRHAEIGGEGQILSSGGATGGTLNLYSQVGLIVLEDREASGDPRPSIEERYASRDDYLSRVILAAHDLITQGYLLAEDRDTLLEQAAKHYDELRNRSRVPQAADN